LDRRFFIFALAPSAAALLAWPARVAAQTAPAGSSPGSVTPGATPSTAPAASEAPVDAVVQGYARIVHAGYLDTLTAARTLQADIRRFLKEPSEPTLAAARRAWLQAREWYGQTEAFRFYGGPIDDEHGPEGRLNAWPLDESYVDGVEGQPDSGLINDRGVAIDRELLVAANERGGEENISTGWHAIEFLLWGQDLDDDGPGKRPFTDYVDGKRANADRRRLYLDTVTDLLVDDLQSLADAWAPEKDNYRAAFEKGGRESLRRIFVGLGSLSRGELAGERLEVAASTQDQEDEHSCFSDNTHRDVVSNAIGIANVWHGKYRRLDGSQLELASLRALVSAADPAIADRTSRQLAASITAAEALQPPFDREIIGDDDAPGRQRVRRLVESLVQQSKDLADAAAAVGVTRLTLKQP
jgi:putative iron-regulated protein